MLVTWVFAPIMDWILWFYKESCYLVNRTPDLIFLEGFQCYLMKHVDGKKYKHKVVHNDEGLERVSFPACHVLRPQVYNQKIWCCEDKGGVRGVHQRPSIYSWI